MFHSASKNFGIKIDHFQKSFLNSVHSLLKYVHVDINEKKTILITATMMTSPAMLPWPQRKRPEATLHGGFGLGILITNPDITDMVLTITR